MEVDWILITKIAILSLIHWILVPVALNALIRRPRVIGGRKSIWALGIIFVTCVGSLLYLIFHPQFENLPSASRINNTLKW